MRTVRNIPVTGAEDRTFLLDVYYTPGQPLLGRIVFSHGFKGFKDWGHWDLLGQAFAEAGFLFAKYNFSHNGTTPAAPAEFHDLEAFGNNNYSHELTDLQATLDWLDQANAELDGLSGQQEPFILIGHSRGGPISLIQALEDKRVGALITWASVDSLAYAWPDQAFIDKWKREGAYYVVNGRTGQEMPLFYQKYEDYLAGGDRFDTERAARALQKPWLIIHGTDDPAVPEAAAHHLHQWNPQAKLELIGGADHVFGGSHPYEKDELPPHSQQLLTASLAFARRALED